MSRVAIRQISRSREPVRMALFVNDQASHSAAVYDGEQDPLHLHRVDLAPSGTVTWIRSPRGHLAYVLQGDVIVGERVLGEGSVVLVEHGASAQALSSFGAQLLVFAPGPACRTAPARPGGRVHVLAGGDTPRCPDFYGDGRVGGAVMADSCCLTCELWLHESSIHRPDFEVAVHSHSEDEIIVVTGGGIVLGNRTYGPGTAIAIARDTLYGFRSGPSGLTFVNFRPSRPFYVPQDRSLPVMDEREHYLEKMPAPVPEFISCAG